MAITASVQPDLGWVAYIYMLDIPHTVWFHSSEVGPDHIVQNWPRSDLDGLLRFWPNRSGPEASCCARIIGSTSGRMHPANYQFPTFRLSCILPLTAQVILCNTRLDLIWFWLTVRFGLK